MSNEEVEFEELASDASSECSDEEIKISKPVKPFKLTYNPEIINCRYLATLTFWSISLYLNVSDNEYDTNIGNLVENIGPAKIGDYVMLDNNGDQVSKFYVIIQKPVIFDPKKKRL